MKYKKQIIGFVGLMILALISLSVVIANDTTDSNDNVEFLNSYSRFTDTYKQNYNIDINFTSVSQEDYDYLAKQDNYNFYIKENSNWGDGTKYCANHSDNEYCLTYQTQDMSYRDNYGSQDYISSIQSSTGEVDGNVFNYPDVYPNTNLTLKAYDGLLKEDYIISELPSEPSSDLNENITLDFGGYVKFPDLDMYVNNQKVTSDIVTSEKIEFRKDNKTLFYLPKPYAYDSDNSRINIEYEVEFRDNQIWFYTRTPYDWLNSSDRVYPVHIDPSIMNTKTGNNMYIFDVKEIERTQYENNKSGLYYNVNLNITLTDFGKELKENTDLNTQSVKDYLNNQYKYKPQNSDEFNDSQVNELINDYTNPPIQATKGNLENYEFGDFNLINNSYEQVEVNASFTTKGSWKNYGVRIKIGSGSTEWGLETTLTDTSESVNAFDFSDNNDYLAIGGDNQVVYIYNVDDWSTEESLTFPDNDINDIEFSPNNNYLGFTNGGDVEIYDTSDWSSETTLTRESTSALSLGWRNDTSHIAYGGFDSTVYVDDTSDWSSHDSFSADDWISSIDYSDSYFGFSTFNADSIGAYIYDLDYNSVHNFTDTADVEDISISPNSDYIAYGSGDNNAYVEKTSDWSLEANLSEATDNVRAIKFSPDNTFLAYSSYDNNAYVHYVNDWSLTTTLTESSDQLQDLGFNPTTEYLGLASDDDNTYIYNTNTKPNQPTLNFPENDSTGINYTNGVDLNVTVTDPDGDDLNSSFYDNSDDSLIGEQTNTNNGSNAVQTWDNLDDYTTYEWYVNVTDGYETTQSQTWNFTTADLTPPSINIINPENKNYATNESLPLNYTSIDSGVGVDSCWYNVYNETDDLIIDNTTLTNCENTTFELPDGDIDYTLNLYSNDTESNQNKESRNFGVRTNAPSISLSYPDDSYINETENIQFNYTPDDNDDIDTCKFYNNVSGDWGVSDIDDNPDVDSVNSFYENTTEGNYIWNVWCNDTVGNSAFALSNKTFSIDITNPLLDIKKPVNNTTYKSSDDYTTIPLDYITSDLNLDYCEYSLNSTDGGNTIDSRTLDACSNDTFSAKVTNTTGEKYTYQLTHCSYDKAGNKNCSFNSDYSVQFYTEYEEPPTDGGGGGAVEELNWTMETDRGNDRYELLMLPNDIRTKDLFLFNYEDDDNVSITMDCEGELCDYINYDSDRLDLPVEKGEATINEFTIELRNATIDEGEYSANLIAIDQNAKSQVVTVDVNIDSKNILTSLINKMGENDKWIGIPYFIYFLFLLFFITIIMGEIIPKKMKGGSFISFIIGFTSSILIILYAI